MSLPTDKTNLDPLAPRVAGQLIVSADWNALVAAVKSIQATVNALSEAADAELKKLTDNVQQLTTDLKTAGDRITALEGIAGQYFRVTLETSQSTYAIGEVAVITVRVADLAGKPVALTADNRPWISFLASWGRLRAAEGFESTGGSGDRAILVRTDQQGVAQVRLEPDHAEFFPLELENDVSAAMTSRVAVNNRPVADLIRTAETPAAAKDAGAYRMLSLEYDRADSSSLRTYVDTYYQKYPDRISGFNFPNFGVQWFDYRATVMCMVQAGNDPHTADFSHGGASLQVAFRDWIGPWYNLEYSADTGNLLTLYRDRLAPRFTTDPVESTQLVKQEVNAIVGGKGLLGKQRDYAVIRESLAQINLPQPPAFLNAVTQSVQSAISIQQSLSTVQAAVVSGPSQDVAFEVFTDAAARSHTNAASSALADMQNQVQQVQKGIADIGKRVDGLNSTVTTVGARVDSALADGGPVQSLRTEVTALKGQVGAFQALNPSDIQSKIGTINDLRDRVFQLETNR